MAWDIVLKYLNYAIWFWLSFPHAELVSRHIPQHRSAEIQRELVMKTKFRDSQ